MWKPEHRVAARRVGQRYESDLTDEEWMLVAPLIPPAKRGGGKRSVNIREVLNAIFYVLWTGCQWKAVPREFGSGSTVHRRFQRWVDHGVWEAMWRLLLQYYDAAESLEWTWQSADASLHKAPLGGEKNGAEPDRPRQGGDQAPCPHRRRRRADRLGDHGGQYAGQGGAG